jgi:hypothetical protein
MNQPAGHAKAWLWIAAALPAIVPLLLIFNYGVDFPILDEWAPDLAGLYIKAHQHHLTFAALVAQHNEHRIFIPRLMLLAINSLTSFNTIWEMILAWVIISITSVGILRLIQGTHEGERVTRIAGLWFLCNLLIFTSAQWEDLIWGVGVINVTPMALCVWMLVVLTAERISVWHLAIAILLAAAATHSSGNGFLAWPMGLMLMAWPRIRASKFHVIGWFVAALLFVGLYVGTYKEPMHEGTYPYATNVTAPLLYLLAFLGGPFAFSSPLDPVHMAMIAGAIMLVAILGAAIYVLRLRKDSVLSSRAIVWLDVAFFAIGSGALAALARAGFTPGQALQSRYVTFALYLPVAMLVLIPIVCEHWGRRTSSRWVAAARNLGPMTATAIVLLEIFCYPPAIDTSAAEYRARLQTKGAQLLANVLPNNPMLPRLVYPDPQLAIEEANTLSEMGWLRPKMITSPNAALIQENDPARIARVKGALERGGKRSATEIAVTGWAAFADQQRPADAVFLTYDAAHGEPIIFAMPELGIRRDDIAQDLGSSEYALSGWLAILPPSVLPKDMPQVTVRAWAFETDTAKAVLLPGSTVLHRD